MFIVSTRGPVYLKVYNTTNTVYNIHLHLVCLFSRQSYVDCQSTAVSLYNLQAFMYTDKHGEVCPAGWQPGADTIIPDPKVSSQSCSQLVVCWPNCPGEAGLFQEAGWPVKIGTRGSGCEVLLNRLWSILCDKATPFYFILISNAFERALFQFSYLI